MSLIAAFIVTMHQSQDTARLYYTGYVNNVQSVMLVTKISDRIEQLDVDMFSTPVVFIGQLGYQRNNSCLSSSDFELSGYSFFEISFSTMHGTKIMSNYMRTLGINYMLPDEEQIALAENKSKNMGTWPDTESVQYSDGIVIVKLSD